MRLEAQIEVPGAIAVHSDAALLSGEGVEILADLEIGGSLYVEGVRIGVALCHVPDIERHYVLGDAFPAAFTVRSTRIDCVLELPPLSRTD